MYHSRMRWRCVARATGESLFFQGYANLSSLLGKKRNALVDSEVATQILVEPFSFLIILQIIYSLNQFWSSERKKKLILISIHSLGKTSTSIVIFLNLVTLRPYTSFCYVIDQHKLLNCWILKIHSLQVSTKKFNKRESLISIGYSAYKYQIP